MVAFVLCGIMAGTQWMNVSAAEIGENVPDAITEETEVTSIGEVNYDMEQGGKQVFTIPQSQALLRVSLAICHLPTTLIDTSA